MVTKYLASVIIPTYNRSKLLLMSLASLSRQTIRNDCFEIIIVDDGSIDDTANIIDGFRKNLNIKYLYLEHNGFGAARGRNIGIDNAEGRICIFVDSGVLLSENAIKEHVNSHDSKIKYGVIGYMYGFDRYNENSAAIEAMGIDPYHIDQYFNELENKKILDMREPLYKSLGDDLTKWPAPWVFFWTGYLSVEKEILLAVGKFDEHYQTWGYEDIDLGLALYTNNIKIILNRKLKSLHYPHIKNKSAFSPGELEAHTANKRQYIHSKYQLKETEIFTQIGGWDLNKRLLDGGFNENSTCHS